LLNHRYQATLSVLDRLQIGVVISNPVGDILITNKEGSNILAAQNGIKKTSQKILQVHPENLNQHLLHSIKVASDPTQNEKYKSLMVIPKRDGTQPWLLETLPLSDLHGNIDGSFQGALTFVTDPDKNDIISVDGIDQLYNLTSAEGEICAYLTDGLKPSEIAETRNVALGTVRSQIRALLEKTNTNSQLDLVRLALKVNLPVERKE